MKKVIYLNQRKLEAEIEDHLEQIGMDREMIEEYDSSINEAAREGILDFFNKREEISRKFDNCIAENFSNEKEMLVFLSVMSEHIHNLLGSLGNEEDNIKALNTIDEMLVIAGAFE